MGITPSSSTEIRSLVDALSAGDEVRREAAIARLAVIGGRATDRLIAAYRSATGSDVRIAILRALEGITDTRAVALACEALQEAGEAAVAAAAVLRPILQAKETSSATAALDALVEVALDPSKPRRVRRAAYRALQDIPAGMLAEVTDALKIGGSGGVREDAAHDAIFGDALDGRLPDDPTELREAVIAKGPTAPLASLQKLIDAIRLRERSAKGPARAAWQQVRGAAHQALALRGSRIAVYDLKETIEAADAPLPPAFLSAMRGVGDATCIEALAAALAHAPESDLWWRHQLASALRGIARRERLTKRHAAMKRALVRWPQLSEALR